MNGELAFSRAKMPGVKMVLGAGDEICNLNSAFICTEGENIVKFGDAMTIEMQRSPHTPCCLLCF